jgi:hypothetical protein
LIGCTFFDWDSALYEIRTGKLTMPDDYLDRLRRNVMDIRLEQNPNPAGSLIRALRRAALWQVRFGPRLTLFSQKVLSELCWKDLVALDSRAFPVPVLKYLDKDRVLAQLQLPDDLEATCPVPDWESQLTLQY